MAKKKLHRLYRTRFTVTGDGHFPVDMLRYDCAHPSASRDVPLLSPRRPALRSVDLIMTSGNPDGPTVGRWASFGWTVSNIVSLEQY